MSTFNPDDLLHTAVDGAQDTKLIPVPIGEWDGILGKPSFRQAEIKRGERAGETMTFMDIMVYIEDEEVKEITHRDKPAVRHSIILTLNDDGLISSEPGENIDLGRLREACGLNDEDSDFTPIMLENQAVRVTVKHRPDPDDASIVYAEVKGVRARD